MKSSDGKTMLMSIFGKKLEILQDNENDMEIIVRCHNCGQPTPYGLMRMCSGYVGCDNKVKIAGVEKDCYFEDLLQRVLEARENNYKRYTNGKFYRHEDKLGFDKVEV